MSAARWERVQILFERAIGLPPDARRALLDDARSGDPDVARDVAGLLAAYERSGDPSLPLSWLGSLTALEGPAANRPEALPGGSIRHYLIECELGRGGMGIVYRAYDPRLERHVAAKVLPDEVACDPARLARFRREAKLLAVMNHANVATIYGLEELADGRYAIIMELLEGETLAARLRRRPLSLKEALEICDQMAAALVQAHACGVIHRDLKPGNTMVSPDGVVKVLDFGLARRVADFEETVTTPAAPEEVSILDNLRFAGTPGYMSPEQIRGEPDDHRTDIFAFGCILFECITGHTAFGGVLPRERIARTLGAGPDWSLCPPGVPNRVRELATWCLEPHRERRLGDLRRARDVLRSARGLPVTPAPVMVRGLAHPSTSFIGRSVELAELDLALRRASLVTLTGLGGSGKTRLAQEVCLRAAASFPDGTAFVDLAPIQDSAHVPLAVTAILGLRDQAGRSAIEVLVDHLQEKELLLVLDNCEHVLGACMNLAAGLLRECPTMKILATSREALGVAGEQEYPVPPLKLPQEDRPRPEHLRDNEAIRLFVERARLVRPGFDITEENSATVANICRRVDGIPLGIELAAARVKALAPGQILMRLQSDLRILATGRSTSSRHVALDGAIRWSYQQLAERQRKTFRAVSVFAGGWTLEAVEAIGGETPNSFDTLEDLTQLVAKSLVLVEPDQAGGFRYRMLETIRQVAREELRAAGEEAAILARHVDFFLEWVLDLEPRIVGPEQLATLRGLDADRENLLAAAHYCEVLPDGAEKALRLLAGLDRFWVRRGHFEMGEVALRRALAMPGAERHTIHRARALCAAATIAIVRGTDAEATRLYREALDLSRTLGDKRVAARALNGLGVCSIDIGDLTSAREYLESSVASGTEAGDVHVVAMASGNLAVIAFNQKEFDRARMLFEKGVERYRTLQDTGGALANLAGVSRSALFLGDIALARDSLRETVLLIEKVGDTRNGATSLLTAGLLAVKVGAPGTAAKLLAAGEALRASILGQARLAPADQEQMDMAVSTIRDTLGQPELDKAWAEGRSLDFRASMRAVLEFVGPESDPSGRNS